MKQAGFSVYVHVPFCAQKCPYCDFNTYATKSIPEGDYVDALLSEMRWHAAHAMVDRGPAITVFFGGGTPSLLSPTAIKKLINDIAIVFGISPDAEISLEANPSGMSAPTYRALLDAGVNRLSFGVQSFDDAQLSVLGRDHSSKQAIQAIKDAHRAGFKRISLDLMCGVPGQSCDGFEQDIAVATSLPIEHLSVYALSVEPGTPFFQRFERGLLALPPEDEVVSMLSTLPKRLYECGFSRYEISNYARPGQESVHNTVYWEGGDYLGLGAGAHSFVRQRVRGYQTARRWSNVALPATYMKAARDGTMISWRESLSEDALSYEFFYLGLRMTKGVSKDDFCRRFGATRWDLYEATIADLIREGLIAEDGDRLFLSERGILISDSVFEQLVVTR